MSANPAFLLVAAIGALVGAYALLSNETEKSITIQRDFIKEIDETSKAIDSDIKKRRELIKIQGDLNVALAKTEEEKIKARQETEKLLAVEDPKSLENQKNTIEAKINEFKRELDLSLVFIKSRLDAEKTLQDFNAEAGLTELQRKEAALVRSQELLSEEKRFNFEFYQDLIKLREQYSNFEDEKDRDSFIKKRDELNNLVGQLKDTQNQIDVFAERQAADEKIRNEELLKAQKDAYKKRKESLEEYNKSVEGLNKKRLESEKQLNRQLEDIEIDRISQVIGFDGVRREDLIKGYDEQRERIRVLYERQLEDAKAAFEDEVKEFRKVAEKKKIAKEKIDADIKNLQDRFNSEQKLREERLSKEIEEIESQKAAKILEINDILNRELVFGDNSLSDSRKRIALDLVDFEISILDRQIELNRGYNEKLLKDRQEYYKKRIKASKDAETEEILIAFNESLKNIQGTEEQKATQKKALEEKLQTDLNNIRRKYAQEEKNIDRQNQDEIYQYRVQKLNEYGQLLNSFTSQALALASAITENNRVELDNQLMDLRDNSNEQVSILNEQYNANLAALQAQYQNGLITQEQYNQQSNALNQNLAQSTNKINEEQRKKETEMKKKAFEEDKKLKIAQTIISGLQGALTAFTSAFQLGPIAGPIVGAILSALVAATTAVQVDAISKTKFDAGPQPITPVNSGSGESFGSNNQNNNLPSGTPGGFTQFNEGLVGNPNGGFNNPGSSGGDVVKVVVLESDITGAQRRVSVAESTSSFG